jgi:acyl-CoA thioesterase FadM
MGTGFVIREIVGVHHAEIHFGEDLEARTWIRATRRGVLMNRETRVGEKFAATAEWVHVGPPPGVAYADALRSGAIGPVRAPSELSDAFPAEGGHTVPFPAWEEREPCALPGWEFSPWWTEMDPMGHTNHPRYVDWADEALSRWLHGKGIDPIGLIPVAERVRFRAGARAGESIHLTGARVGATEGGTVFQLRAERRSESGTEIVADITAIRRHVDADLSA